VWVAQVLQKHPGLIRCQGRIVLVADGLKNPKTGRKMPGVKKLHQSAAGNTKPPYIMGHSCQAVAALVHAGPSVAALPLAARIHEGLVFSNRDQRTLLDKLILLLDGLALSEPFYLVADAYYASRKIVLPLLERGQHLVCRAKIIAVAYESAPQPKTPQRGRPRKYGRKIPLRSLFARPQDMIAVQSPVYGETGVTIRLRSVDLLWRPVGRLVRFVAVDHPLRGRMILLCTDLTLPPLEIVRLYGWRFKIELTFKNALRVLGAFGYHFWMRLMTPIKRNAGNQYLHRKSDQYRAAVRRKLQAYHRFIQLGLIAQGILIALATTRPARVWTCFRSWIRTRRPNVHPSERSTAIALRNSLHDFLADPAADPILAKFLRQRLDGSNANAQRWAA
jgi:hypothetical protein